MNIIKFGGGGLGWWPPSSWKQSVSCHEWRNWWDKDLRNEFLIYKWRRQRATSPSTRWWHCRRSWKSDEIYFNFLRKYAEILKSTLVVTPLIFCYFFFTFSSLPPHVCVLDFINISNEMKWNQIFSLFQYIFPLFMWNHNGLGSNHVILVWDELD